MTGLGPLTARAMGRTKPEDRGGPTIDEKNNSGMNGNRLLVAANPEAWQRRKTAR